MRRETFLDGYLACALWSSSLPLLGEWTSEARKQAEKTCADFMADNADALERYYEKTARPESYAGHDLWLTRNGHGAGFWDRCNNDAFPELCKAAEELGEQHPYQGDDNKIYFYG